jgi:TRAP-type transport system small permease protein
MSVSSGDQIRSGTTYWLGTMPSQVLGIVSCLLLFSMMLLTFVDVAGRYVFDMPLPAAYEMIAFVMPGIIFCALPHVNLNEGHVTIDLLDHFIPDTVKRWQSVFINLFSAVAVAFISWRLWARSRDHLRFGEVTDELYLELWIFSTIMSILCAIATIAFFVNAYGYATNTKRRNKDDGVTST